MGWCESGVVGVKPRAVALQFQRLILLAASLESLCTG